ncbi:MAG: hypothetical protein GXP17_01805 [Gammaproteobacteria bacterium]|nr:hypothetical protein [Gammaproteobacteria bacterium]
MLKNNTQPPQRLMDISHYFLSEANERLPIWQHTTIIPVLLGSWNDDHVVYALGRAFEQQHRSCMVLNIENHQVGGAPLASPLSPPQQKTSPEQNVDAEPGLPQLALIPLISTSTTLAVQSDHIIIAVDSSLSGVRLAYDQLTFLASLETDFTVNVIMINASQACDAMRFYRFIFDSSESLLGLAVEYAGFLLSTRCNHPPETTDINDIARDILEKLTPASTPQQQGREKISTIDSISPIARLLS